MHVWMAIVACREEEPVPADVPVVVVDDDHAAVWHVTWTSPAPSDASWVEFGPIAPEFSLDASFAQRSPADPGGTAHAHELLGLKAGRTYQGRVADEVDGVVRYSDPFTFDVAPAPVELPVLTVTVDEADASLHGKYLLFLGASEANVAYQDDTVFYVAIVDGDGDYVWWHLLPPGSGTNGAFPWSDGQSLYWLEVPILREETDGYVRRMRLDGTDLGASLAVTGHHAAVEIAGERVAHLGRRFFPDEAGGARSTDRLMIVDADDPAGASSTERFDYFDDWWGGDMANYPLGPCPEYWESAFGYTPNCELSHSNSIGYVEEEGALYAYARLLDALLKVDADTGELLWVIGGASSDFGSAATGTASGEAPRLWSGGHFSQVFADGLVMFDNGIGYVPQRSSLIEVKWDEDARTVEEIFRFPDPEGGFTSPLGDAKRLHSGNYVGSWMSLGKLNEVTPDGRIVWEVRGDLASRRIWVLNQLYDLRDAFHD